MPGLAVAPLFIALTLLLAAASATAATVPTHPLVGSLTPPASATPDGPFWPGGIAVNQATGDVYVIDITNDVIDVFDSSGKFLFKIAGSETPAGAFEFNAGCCTGSIASQLAIDNSGGPDAGRIYIANEAGQGEVVAFAADRTFDFAIPELKSTAGIAVDSQGRLVTALAKKIRFLDAEDAARALEKDEIDALVQRRIDVAEVVTISANSIAVDSVGNLYLTSHVATRLGKYDLTDKLEWAVAESGSPTAVAVDRTSGRVYALDDQYGFDGFTGDARTIAEYDPSGNLLGRFGLSLIPDGGSIRASGIAVGESSGRVYAADPVNERVAVFGPQANSTAPDATVGAATDVTGTPATGSGDLSLLATGSGDLGKDSTTVTNLTTDTGTFSVGESISGSGIVVGTTIVAVGGGTLTLSDPATADGAGVSLNSGSKTVTNFSATSGSFTVGEAVLGSGISAGTFITAVGGGTLTLSRGATAAGTDVSLSIDTTATLHGTVNPAGVSAAARFQYRRLKTRKWLSSPLQAFAPGASDVPLSAPVGGLSQNTTYEVRVQAANADNGAISTLANTTTFTTPGLPQTILVIDAVSSLTDSSAHLSGTLDPSGSDSGWHCEFATDNSFEEEWTAVGADQHISAGSGTTAVSADLTGLQPNTHYFARLIGTNDGGPKASAEIEFTTDPVPPEAFTLAAGCLTPDSACLAAMIDAKNAATTYHFEYGTDDSYGISVPLTEDADAGAGFGPVKRTQQITGLEPDTVYHYRLVADSIGGTTTTPDATLKTHPLSGAAEASWPRRGFELVSLPDKGNQNLNVWRVSPSGERVLWSTPGGAPGSTTGFQAPFLSVRSAAGWEPRSLTPPADQQPAPGHGGYLPISFPPDLSAFVFGVKEGIFGRSGPETAVRVDDSGSQTRLGAEAFPTGSDLGVAGGEGSADASHFFFPDFTTEPVASSFFKLSAETSESIDMPDCGATLPTRTPNAPSYSWLTPSGRFAFVESAGDGPCTADTAVFRIDTETASAVLVSGPQTSPAAFRRAGADGSAAIYHKAGELYRWDEGAGSTCLTCSTGGTEVLLNRMVISEDLSRVYFQSPRRLVSPGGIVDAPCAMKSGSACNLYVWHEGEVDFVAVYADNDDRAAQGFSERAVTADATSDGAVLAFISADPRTSAHPTGSTGQIYRYDDRNGRLECVSCPASSTSLPGTWGVPKPQIRARNASDILSGDGRTVAFVTTAPLRAEDVNGTPDLYEWHVGFVRLVTDGVSEFSDTFAIPAAYGVSDDGRNLVFSQAGRHVGNESDALANIYNARLGGGLRLEEPPASCVEDACQGPLEAPPPHTDPASGSFSGFGNVVEGRGCAPTARFRRLMGSARDYSRRAARLRRVAARFSDRRRREATERRARRAAAEAKRRSAAARKESGAARRCRQANRNRGGGR